MNPQLSESVEVIELGLRRTSSPTSRTIGKLSFDDGAEVPIPKSAQLSEVSLPPIDDPNINRSCVKVTRKVAYHSAKSTIILFLIFAMLAAFVGWKVVEDRELTRNHVLMGIFALGLCTVALEDALHMDKSAIMLLCAGVMWTVLAVSDHPSESKKGREKLQNQLEDAVEEVGQLLLFLLPAMGLCESIDYFNGFDVVAHAVRWSMAGRKQLLMPIICIFTFILCTVVDSMSAMLVALKTLRRLEPRDENWRRQCGSLAVLGANACVWSPIGEVTTAMLWIGGKITPLTTARWLIIPSLASLAVPLMLLWGLALRRDRMMGEKSCSKEPQPAGPGFAQISTREGDAKELSESEEESGQGSHKHTTALRVAPDVQIEELTRSSLVTFCIGISCIMTVPVLKMHTNLPPYFGMLFALGLMWFVTDALGLGAALKKREHDGSPPGVIAALHNVDLAGLLFFAGVLQSVAALHAANILHEFAAVLKRVFGGNPVTMSITLGLSSALVDNVPLVEAAIDMFDGIAVDDRLWQLVALAAGTGGSLLSTGGIAGVTFMGMEGVSFLWYLKNVSLFALIGFFSGILTYHLQWLAMAR